MSNQLKLPMYVKSRAASYQQIVDEFHTEIAKARTKEEYEATLERQCTRWDYELTDEYVMAYLLYSGELDKEDYEAINNYYISHAGPLQKAVLDAKMESGKKYTLLYYNEFGFPVADQIVFERASITQYAQYKDAVKLVFKRPRAKSSVEVYFYNCTIAVYEGWRVLSDEDTHVVLSDNDNATVKRSKYRCFDPAYFSDTVKKFGEPLMKHNNTSIRECDGRAFA